MGIGATSGIPQSSRNEIARACEFGRGFQAGYRSSCSQRALRVEGGGFPMIIKGIQVEGWACFSNRIDVGPLDERINVLYGPNGTGKSTLSRIITRGLVENHGVGGAEAQSLRPWGRGLTPKVTIEFVHG